MKRIAGVIILALTFLAPAVFAQNEEHGEFGVFVDYTRLHHFGDANMWGPGAQVSFNINKYFQLEGGMAYDLERTFSTQTVTGTTITTNRSNLRLLHGLFGPKIQTGIGPIKAFALVKGGLLNFQVSNQGTGTGFVSAVNNVPHGDTNGVLYPGGGVEFFAKWFGIRAEIGDEIYFDNGANHNLKFTVGPTFRW
jgi:hypothetical protein